MASEFIDTANERFRVAMNAWNELKLKFQEDLKFYSGDQWDPETLATRTGQERPCLVINKMPQYVRQVTNEMRQNRPSIKMTPAEGGDKDVAEVIQGLARNIEVVSSASIAYDTSFEHCCQMGLGWVRLTLEYIAANTFQQRIKIDRVLNPFSVTVDPLVTMADYSDMKYAFVTEDISHEDFERDYPGHELGDLSNYRSVGDDMMDWVPAEGKIRIAEYYYFDKQTHALIEAELREKVTDKVLGPAVTFKQADQPEPPEGRYYHKLEEREVEEDVVKYAKINGIEPLEETEWPGKWIPLVPCVADEFFVDGKREIKGMIRDAMDPARMNNYWASKESEAIALAPMAPMIGPSGAFDGHTQAWQDAVKQPVAYLEYNTKTLGGKLLPPPSRAPFEASNIQAISIARQSANNDLEDVLGLHGPSMGRRQRADSGVAIKNLQQEGDTANFHYIDNLSRMIRHVGRIIVDLIPKVQTTERIERILGEDSSERQEIVVNEPGQPAMQEREAEEEGGKAVKVFNVGVGTYDVIVDTGPSFVTKRQEGAAAMIELSQTAAGGVFIERAPDLLVRMLDIPDGDAIADRMKPPGVDDESDMPPEAQAAVAQMQQQMQEMQQALEGAQQKIAADEAANASREKVAEIKAQVEMQSSQAKLELEREQMQFDHAIELEKLEIEKEKVRVDAETDDRKIASTEAIKDAERRQEKEAPISLTTQ